MVIIFGAREEDRIMHVFRCSAIKRHKNGHRLHFVRFIKPPNKLAETLTPHTTQAVSAASLLAEGSAVAFHNFLSS